MVSVKKKKKKNQICLFKTFFHNFMVHSKFASVYWPPLHQGSQANMNVFVKGLTTDSSGNNKNVPFLEHASSS